jgi:hypothetical protein
LAFFTANARPSVFATPPSVMPGLSGVTAPITPDNRTTGTTAVPRCHRLGISFISAALVPSLMAFS